jgi:hypothetical protein
LKAFASSGQQPPGGGKPKKDAGPDKGEMQEGGDDKFGALLPILEEGAGDIESAAESMTVSPDEVFGAEEPEQAWHDEAGHTLDELDEDLKDALAPLKGVSVDEAHDLADHLSEEGMIEDADAVAAWLYLVGCHMEHAGGEGEDGESDEDEDLEDEDLEDEEGEY